MEWQAYRYDLGRRLFLDGPVDEGFEVLRELEGFRADALAEGKTENDFAQGLGSPEGVAVRTGRDRKCFGIGVLLLGLMLLIMRLQPGIQLPWNVWRSMAAVTLLLLPMVLWLLFQVRRRALVAALTPPPRKRWVWGMAFGALLLLAYFTQLLLWMNFVTSAPNMDAVYPWIFVNRLLCWAIWAAVLAGLGISLRALWRCRLWGFAGCVWWPGLLWSMALVDAVLRSMDMEAGPLWLAFLPAAVCAAITPILTALALLALRRARKEAERQWTHS